MASEFRNLARRRLVILGAPGMGKTTLAVLLMRRLLEDRQPGDPVPVMFTLSGWDPTSQRFHDWLTRRLSDTYPALRANSFGPNAPRALVTERRILPVLDGLDELPKSLHPVVITELNASFTDADALILTCRTSEYVAATKAPGGDVLTAGAVIEPDHLRPGDAADYLTHVLPPNPSGTWPTLLELLTHDADTPLAQALTTPLALWLVRKVYIDAHTDPKPLLNERFTTADQITNHLLDHLSQAVITANRPDRTNNDQDRQDHPFRPRHTWNPADAQRWLSFLAHYLDTAKTTDFAWWQLHAVFTVRYIRLITVAITGPVGGLAAGLAFGLTYGLSTGITVGFTYGLICFLSLSLIAWLSSSNSFMNLDTSHADLRLGGRIRPLVRDLAYGLINTAFFGLTFWKAFGPKIGLTIGLLFGLVGALVANLTGGRYTSGMPPNPDPSFADLRLHGRIRPLIRNLAGGLFAGAPIGLTVGLISDLPSEVGLVVGSLYGLTLGLTSWAKNPQASDTGQTPPDSLRRDLQMAYVESFAFTATIGIVAVLVFRIGLVGALAGSSALVLTNGLPSSSGTYRITLIHLAIRRQTPFRLMRFLQDAHRLGLLRQTGATYQLRHAKLQERLATTHASSQINANKSRTALPRNNSTSSAS